jgi:hypothetical protein
MDSGFGCHARRTWSPPTSSNRGDCRGGGGWSGRFFGGVWLDDCAGYNGAVVRGVVRPDEVVMMMMDWQTEKQEAASGKCFHFFDRRLSKSNNFALASVVH